MPDGRGPDLMFSGRLTAHIKCSTSPATCMKEYASRQRSGGLAAAISGVGSTVVQLLIRFFTETPGPYVAAPLGDEKTSSPQGATLDGIGHWARRTTAAR